jgi:osmotically-inducible protein OsmY
MDSKFGNLLVIFPATVFALATCIPAFAENSDITANDSMHSAASSLKEAGSDTADALKHTYRGVKTAAEDTKITAKVKTVLHDSKAVGESDIRVSTEAGVVTLRGDLPSREAAMNAEQLAQQTEGVKRVNNELTVMAAGNTPQ